VCREGPVSHVSYSTKGKSPECYRVTTPRVRSNFVRVEKCQFLSISAQTNPQPGSHLPWSHLSRNASQEDVKRRCTYSSHITACARPNRPDYGLVWIYHPDSVVARHYLTEMSPARFQAISKAYDILWGKASSSGEPIEATRKVQSGHNTVTVVRY
jgi:hypothetical protein